MTWTDFSVALPDHAWWMMAGVFVIFLFLLYKLYKYEHVHPECPDEAQKKIEDARTLGLGLLLFLGVFGIPLYVLSNWGLHKTFGLMCQAFS